MFATLEHDFGTVAKDSMQEFRFEFTNLYKEELHISAVRASCGCTIPTAEQDIVKTFEKGTILATYNTKACDSHVRHRLAKLLPAFRNSSIRN